MLFLGLKKNKYSRNLSGREIYLFFFLLRFIFCNHLISFTLVEELILAEWKKHCPKLARPATQERDLRKTYSFNDLVMIMNHIFYH